MAPSPTGGFIFAEDPNRAAPEARIIWRAERDPETLAVIAEPASDNDPERIDPASLAPWLTIVKDAEAIEHSVLTDGWHRIRFDVLRGSLASGHPVRLHYQIEGTSSAGVKLMPLRRLIHLYQHRFFAPALYPPLRSVDYALAVLRGHDAIQAGAVHKDIARVLFGNDRVVADWNASSDFLRSRVRRLVANARRMSGGGFKMMLIEDQRSGVTIKTMRFHSDFS